jgi:Zn-dependent protease with chaperone function
MLAAWWASWDLDGRWVDVFSPQENYRHLLFSIPLITSLFVYQLLNDFTDRTISELHWSQSAILRQAWWSVVQNVVSMLMVAAGFEAIFAGRYVGIIWIVGAAIVHRVGMVFLRLAEGMRFHQLKSGELRNRSLAMARRMGIYVHHVCMVPAGKGHLTTAFGGGGMIALTDALPKYLSRQQIDSVIAHELIHVKHKHARKGSLLLCSAFLVLMIVTFKLPARIIRFRPLLALVVVYAPMLSYYYFSRRAEFTADREAVLCTGDPETAIRALANLYQCSGVPVRGGNLSELFQTHPSLTKRAVAIAQAGGMPADSVSEILKENALLHS